MCMSKYLIYITLFLIIAVSALVYIQSQQNNEDTNSFEVTDHGTDIQASIDQATQNIIGLWENTEENSFVRQFTSDGVFVDTFKGIEKARGVWGVADSTMIPPDAPFIAEPGALYLLAKGPAGIESYRITKLTSTSMTLYYLNEDGIISFTKSLE
jgi:hypothetical protein